MRIAEIDVDICFEREALVVCQLFAVVPGQRFVEFVGKLAGLLGRDSSQAQNDNASLVNTPTTTSPRNMRVKVDSSQAANKLVLK